jgi:hypothetical protein
MFTQPGTEKRERLETPEAIALAYVQQSRVLRSDETSFTQGNGDGANEDKKRAWIWVLVTPVVSVFAVWLSRSQAVAQALILDFGQTPAAHRRFRWAFSSKRGS